MRVFHPIGVVFKGSGFHKTDYAKSGVKPAAAAGESTGGDAKPADSGAPSKSADSGGSAPSGGESKPATPAKPESKPAATQTPKKDT